MVEFFLIGLVIAALLIALLLMKTIELMIGE